MRKIYFWPILLLGSLFGCTDEDPVLDNNSGPAEEGPTIINDFPNIDNTQSMNVADQLSAPTNTNVRLDSMKMFYYQDYHYNENGPGMAYRNQVLTLPIPPIIESYTSYFTYEENGYVDKRTIVNEEKPFWDDQFKFIFDYNYTDDNALESVELVIEKNNEVVYQNNILYTTELQQSALDYVQFNEYNILSQTYYAYVTPKNVYNPEKSLLPEEVKFQFFPLLSLQFYEFLNSEFSEEVNKLFYNYLLPYNYINTHTTFISSRTDQPDYHYPLQNIQYQVRTDHYPEIIQYGQPNTGGYRNLYYYND